MGRGRKIITNSSRDDGQDSANRKSSGSTVTNGAEKNPRIRQTDRRYCTRIGSPNGLYRVTIWTPVTCVIVIECLTARARARCSSAVDVLAQYMLYVCSQ